jgi:radical SAM protein with 4Fe4S-binding SPASM domain
VTISAMDFPAHVNFDVTYRCNASCSFCYVVDRHNDQEVTIDINLAKSILDQLAANGVFRVNFFGGEPLLVKGLPTLIEHATELGLRTTLITNGLPLTERFIADVAGRLETIAVSVHGLGQRHDEVLGVVGGFDKLLGKIALLARSGINLGINYTVLRGSEHEFLPTASHFLKNFPVDFIAANRFVGGHGKDDVKITPSLADLNGVLRGFAQIEAEYPAVDLSYAIYFPFCLVEDPKHVKFLKGCGMGSNFASIDFKGNVRLCSYSEGVLGNVLRTNVRELWRSSPTLQSYRQGQWVPKACRTCSEFDVCKAGCRVSDPTLDFGPDILLKLHPIKPFNVPVKKELLQ